MKNHELNKLISILSELVSFPVLGGTSNLTIANHIEHIFNTFELPYYRVENKTADKVSLHCRIGPPNDGGIILSGHTDVVPTEGQPWTKPDFKLSLDNGKAFGRGTCDMKGFLACCLYLIPEFIRTPLKKPIYLAFSYDEEVGCLAGVELANSIRNRYKENPAFAIIGEPTNMQIVNAEKGMAVYTTTVISSAAHSSAIRSHVSAIEQSTYLIQWLHNKMVDLMETGRIDRRFDPPHTTLHVGTVMGGTAVNIVPDKCKFSWDLRTLPSDSHTTIVEEFERYCNQIIRESKKINPNFSIKTSSNFTEVPGLDTKSDSKLIMLLSQIMEDSLLRAVSYGSEAGQFAEAGFEAVLLGPGSIDQAHKADEYIEIEQLQKCIRFLRKLSNWASN